MSFSAGILRSPHGVRRGQAPILHGALRVRCVQLALRRRVHRARRLLFCVHRVRPSGVLRVPVRIALLLLHMNEKSHYKGLPNYLCINMKINEIIAPSVPWETKTIFLFI